MHYTTKADLKNAADVDISDFAKKTRLANLKSDTHKLGIDKIKSVPSNLWNLQSKVENWLYVLIMSHMLPRVNPHFIVACMLRNSLLETGVKSEV